MLTHRGQRPAVLLREVKGELEGERVRERERREREREPGTANKAIHDWHCLDNVHLSNWRLMREPIGTTK